VGYDLIFAAPRPISVLVALDDAHAPAVVAAHREAVLDAVTYLEQRAVVVRDRRGGRDLDAGARWHDVVGFTHGVNRHGEPHLHDHVLVGARPDTASVVLDSRALYAHVSTADALYRSSLRAGVAATTPYEPWRSFEGVEHVADLDEGYRVLWGGHHSERGEKHHWTRDAVRDAWTSDLSRFESHGVVRAPEHSRDHLDEHTFQSSFEGRTLIARRDLVAAWADAATFGQRATDVVANVDRLYALPGDERGVRETTVSLRDARMIAHTRLRGPRPLGVNELRAWQQRDLTRSRDGRAMTR